MIRLITVKNTLVCLGIAVSLVVSGTGCGGEDLTGAIVRTTDTVLMTTPATIQAPVSDKINITAVPSKTSVKGGDAFDVAIRITSDQANRGVQFLVTWDPAKVSCTSVSEGGYYKDFVAADGGDLIILPSNPVADNTIGQFPKLSGGVKQFIVAMSGGRSLTGPTGTGDVIILHMTAKSGVSGTVEFNITDAKLGDATEKINNLNPKIINGKISITP